MLESDNNSTKTSILNKDFDLSLLVTVLKRNLLVPIAMLLVGLAISYIYLRYTKPVYESTAIIQRSSQDEGKRILDIEGFETESELSEDVELLNSTFLLEKSLRNLNLEVSYFAEGEILTEEKYLFSSYHITLLELKDSSMIGLPIFVKPIGEEIELSFTKGTDQKVIKVPINEAVNNEHFNLIFKVDDQQEFQTNAKNNKLYFVFNDYKLLTNNLHKNLSVYALNPEANTIQISFESNNQRLCEDVVQSVISTFFEYDLEKKRKSSANILDFINTQLDTVYLQLKESESAIQNFRDSSSVTDPKFYTQTILERSNELENQLMVLDFDLELIQNVEQSVQMSNRIEIFKVSAAVSGTSYENLLSNKLEELHELLVEKEDLSYQMTDDNDVMKRLNQNIETTTDNIFRTLTTIRNQLRFRRNTLKTKIYEIESELYGIPAKEMELSRLNRMFDLNEEYYALLIEKKTQYSISKAGFTLDNMVLQAPTDAHLISPNKKFVYLTACVLTIFFSLIYLLIRYLTFNDIHEPEELKKLLSNKVGYLGTIPKVATDEKNSTLIVHLKPKSSLAESFRHIRSNLQFILKPNEPNVIAVSSSVSGEGKTFAAVNLGGIIAMTGKKVLVIDLDLRKPKIHFAFDAENEKGMSNILIGNEDWKSCVQKSELPDLEFITAGPIPPNPSELIIGSQLSVIIEEFKGEYDVIMIDNPPVGIVSDGVSVLNDADCPIYIFRANYSKRFYADRVKELVDNKQVSKLFVVLNGMDSGSRGYGYGYGYGEYYTDDQKPKKVWQFWRKS